jgi:sigma-B regulation protein RsbU (phosphoserine phosphatase)
MVTRTQTIEVGRTGWWPPKGAAGSAFWLGVWFVLFWLLRLVPGWVGDLAGVLQIWVGLALGGVLGALVLRLVRKHMLWSLRNKLVLTYLLIGLAPVVLFVTLVTISAYIAAGQFAIHLADSRLQAELSEMASENVGRARGLSGYLETHEYVMPPPPPVAQAARTEGEDTPSSRLPREMTAYINGVPIEAGSPQGRSPFGLPPWAAELPGSEFQGVVLDGDEIYLVTVHQRRLRDGRIFSMESSVPVNAAVMDMIADGLGRVMMLPSKTGTASSGAKGGASGSSESATRSGNARVGKVRARRGGASSWISGGSEPDGVNLEDIRVAFLSTVTMTDWDTGESDNIPIRVISRPSRLYKQLFGSSLGGIMTSVIRVGLIVLCLVFLLIELLALWMAVRLSKTITASVADLYDATLKIDRGELGHRIGVERQDQLAELSRSFNRMTGSLQRLLLEQQEKERLQNELSIAQEVQANLFPRQDCDLKNLQLHGVCRPARTVSGDYYDFLVFHEDAHEGHPSRRVTGVGIALGDISGKGISAALLMATLHSAVRAYRFASEELVYSETQLAGLTASRDDAGDCDELFQSPGRILSLLNRHLYRSTQPEKYATLFLAHYDAESSMLTYSNAGQLPPLVLRQDGSVLRLDKGGTVVGLMDGMHYEEDRFRMEPGDILVAYSDGVTEAENDFGEFGEERMMEVVRRYRDQPLHVISSQVMQALDAWIGAEEQPDDITLVLVRQL